MARLIGQEGNDTITAGSGSDLIYGKAGDDVLYGNGGNDTILGDAGTDIIYGGAGNDRLYEWWGTVYAYSNGQKMYGGGGDDIIDVAGASVVDGGNGNDEISVSSRGGDGFSDRINIIGGAGDDYINASDGYFEKIDCGSGNDIIEASIYLSAANIVADPSIADGSWIVDGGTGYDVMYLTLSCPVRSAPPLNIFARLTNIEEIIVKGARVSSSSEFGPTRGVDVTPDVVLVNGITSAGGVLKVTGANTTNDIAAIGLGFVDASVVTEYRLELRLSDRARAVNEGFTGAFAIGGARDDFISSLWAAKIYGGNGHDTILASVGNDILIGGAGNDSLSGFDGNDTFTGGSGDETIIGDDGSDTAIYSGNLSDYTIEEVAYNQYRITDTRGALGDGVDLVSGINKLQFSDQTMDVVIRGLNIIGDNSSEVLDGSDDADRISAMGGNDRANGGLGNDWADGGRGNDLVYGGMGDDFAIGGAGNDIIDGGTGDDDLFGGAGRDMLYGGEGEDDFIFRAVNEISNSTIATDTIFGFVSGVDDIDLSVIDASRGGTNDDAFVFRGTGAISASAAGEVSFRIFDAAGSRNDYTLIYIDTDADRAAEAVIRLNDVVMLSEGDFIL